MLQKGTKAYNALYLFQELRLLVSSPAEQTFAQPCYQATGQGVIEKGVDLVVESI